MRHVTKILAGCLVVAAGAWIAGCNSAIDSGNGPAVILEVDNMQIPPITASPDTSGTCTYTMTNATATFKNKPKNAGAVTSPFNDILMQGVDIAYAWDDQTAVPGFSSGIGGSVPANGSSQGSFAPISGADLQAGGGRAGHTASLSMRFRGKTVSGDDVSTTTGGSLVVNSCASVPVGACCTQGGGCNVVSQTSCVGSLGSYQGDNTSCLTTVCP